MKDIDNVYKDLLGHVMHLLEHKLPNECRTLRY